MGFPSNFERLAACYGEAPAVMRNMVYPEVVDDKATEAAITEAWTRYQVLLDPHSAVAFAAARRFCASGDFSGNVHTVILATGHPAKEADLVSKATGQKVEVPGRLAVLRKKVDPIALIDPNLDALQSAIASCV